MKTSRELCSCYNRICQITCLEKSSASACIKPEVAKMWTSQFDFQLIISPSILLWFYEVLIIFHNFKLFLFLTNILADIQHFSLKSLQLKTKQRICLQKHVLFAWSAISQNGFNDCKIILYEQILYGQKYEESDNSKTIYGFASWGKAKNIIINLYPIKADRN